MSAKEHVKRALKRLLLGSSDFSQQVTIGLPDPQTEISVHLYASDETRDVTYRHFMACSAPFLIGISGGGLNLNWDRESKLWLVFQARHGQGRLLGRIRLIPAASLPLGNESLQLFRSGGSRNHCLPLLRLWARYLQFGYLRKHSPNSEINMAARDVHSMCVLYICPRPTGLVTVSDGIATNVFPMNLMGTPSEGYFCFALKTVTPVVPFVTRVGRLAVSNIPVEQAPSAYRLGKNHNRESIDLSQLPFASRGSKLWQLPIPDFALRVREIQVESTYNLGSHTLFVARILHDERCADRPQFFLIHGMYDAWRRKANSTPADRMWAPGIVVR